MNEPLTITVKVDPESLGYLDQLQYLAFFAECCREVYDIDPEENFGLNQAWRDLTGKEVPSFE